MVKAQKHMNTEEAMSARRNGGESEKRNEWMDWADPLKAEGKLTSPTSHNQNQGISSFASPSTPFLTQFHNVF